MKFLLSILLLIFLVMPGVSQRLAAYSQITDNQISSIIDTVTVRRNALTTAIYSQGGEKLSYNALKGLYRGTPAATPALLSQPMRIAAPVVAAGGIALGAVALKGKPKVYETEARTYHYIRRSKPQLAAGLVLLAGGLCLFEWSNDLLAKSARLYNLDQVRKAGKMKAQVGVTEDGVGLVVGF